MKDDERLTERETLAFAQQIIQAHNEHAARLAEATALLERWQAVAGDQALGVNIETRAFLKSSRAPAQPAAPTFAQPFRDLVQPAAPHSEEDCDGSCYVQPAAPEPSLERFFGAVPDMPLEPSAEPAQSFDLLGRWRTRAETAEAKIAAAEQKLARANCLLLCAHPIVARSSDQGLRGAINHHLKDRDVGFDDEAGGGNV